MRRILLLGLASLLSFLFPAAVSAGFAPADRQTYQCVTKDSCPGPTIVTFNSFVGSPSPDAPANGDERAFFEARLSGQSTNFSDPLAIGDGQRVELRVYIHNDANPHLMGDANAMARNTNVSIQLPSGNNANSSAIAYISANNATPRMISDTVDFAANTPVSLSFDTSAAVNITKNDGIDDGDNNFTTTQLSNVFFTQTNSMSVNVGDWPGGFANRGWLTVTAVVHNATPVAPVFNCSSLERSNISATQATFTAHTNGQAAGATITSYNFTVKNSSGQTVDSSTVNTNAQSAVYNFNQTVPGTYTIAVIVNSDKGSSSATVCTQQITVAQPTATLSASTTTTTLPNTGAGDVLSVFGGASLLGAAGHYANRRFRR